VETIKPEVQQRVRLPWVPFATGPATSPSMMPETALIRNASWAILLKQSNIAASVNIRQRASCTR
jgi:hypothetical protein